MPDQCFFISIFDCQMLLVILLFLFTNQIWCQLRRHQTHPSTLAAHQIDPRPGGAQLLAGPGRLAAWHSSGTCVQRNQRMLQLFPSVWDMFQGFFGFRYDSNPKCFDGTNPFSKSMPKTNSKFIHFLPQNHLMCFLLCQLSGFMPWLSTTHPSCEKARVRMCLGMFINILPPNWKLNCLYMFVCIFVASWYHTFHQYAWNDCVFHVLKKLGLFPPWIILA